MVFLGGTLLALTVSTEVIANRLATFAYFSLAIGVGLRIAEQVLEKQRRSIPFNSVVVVQRTIGSENSDGQLVSSVLLRRLVN